LFISNPIFKILKWFYLPGGNSPGESVISIPSLSISFIYI
jgi:hypothetical protein